MRHDVRKGWPFAESRRVFTGEVRNICRTPLADNVERKCGKEKSKNKQLDNSVIGIVLYEEGPKKLDGNGKMDEPKYHSFIYLLMHCIWIGSCPTGKNLPTISVYERLNNIGLLVNLMVRSLNGEVDDPSTPSSWELTLIFDPLLYHRILDDHIMGTRYRSLYSFQGWLESNWLEFESLFACIQSYRVHIDAVFRSLNVDLIFYGSFNSRWFFHERCAVTAGSAQHFRLQNEVKIHFVDYLITIFRNQTETMINDEIKWELLLYRTTVRSGSIKHGSATELELSDMVLVVCAVALGCYQQTMKAKNQVK